jgi:hypothetical protein
MMQTAIDYGPYTSSFFLTTGISFNVLDGDAFHN